MSTSTFPRPLPLARRRSAVAAAAPTALAIALTLAGCAAVAQPAALEPDDTAGHAAAWSYEGASGPASWGSLDSDYGTCSAGTHQSPIDLPAAAAATDDTWSLDYGLTRLEVENNGHTTQIGPETDQLLQRAGVTSELSQMHFHAPSEHTVDGVRADAEFHFVHTDDTDHLTVVGVLAVEGAETPSWNTFIDAAATPVGEEREIEIDLGTLLPADLGFDEYTGSLTTPPCSEDVDWIVLTTPITLSAEQLTKLEAAHVGNNRPTQPLGDRAVSEGLAR